MGGELLAIEFALMLHLKPFFIIILAIVGATLFVGYKLTMWWIKKK